MAGARLSCHGRARAWMGRVWLLILAAVPLVAADAARRPNVLLIVSDDQRPDTIGALGNRWIRTPQLDQLVRDGTAFTRAIAPIPHCTPSRAEILTGASTFANGSPPLGKAMSPAMVFWATRCGAPATARGMRGSG